MVIGRKLAPESLVKEAFGLGRCEVLCKGDFATMICGYTSQLSENGPSLSNTVQKAFPSRNITGDLILKLGQLGRPLRTPKTEQLVGTKGRKNSTGPVVLSDFSVVFQSVGGSVCGAKNLDIETPWNKKN